MSVLSVLRGACACMLHLLLLLVCEPCLFLLHPAEAVAGVGISPFYACEPPLLPLSCLVGWPMTRDFCYDFASAGVVSQNLSLSALTGDHNYIKGNSKFFSCRSVCCHERVPLRYPGILHVFGASLFLVQCVWWRWPRVRASVLCCGQGPQRLPHRQRPRWCRLRHRLVRGPCVHANVGCLVLDVLTWPLCMCARAHAPSRNPFNDNILATCACLNTLRCVLALLRVRGVFHYYSSSPAASDDTTVKFWHIPDGGLTERISTPLQTLAGHGKPVTLLHFHPTANNVIASAAKDPSIKVWDIERGEAKLTLSDFGGLVQDFDWNYDGSFLATSSKVCPRVPLQCRV